MRFLGIIPCLLAVVAVWAARRYVSSPSNVRDTAQYFRTTSDAEFARQRFAYYVVALVLLSVGVALFVTGG
jgi:hypothetical protein